MLNERQMMLIHGRIDGANSPTEDTELDRLLTGSPEAQRTFEGLQKSLADLSTLPRVEPPARIRQGVMAEIGMASSSRRGFHFSLGYGVAMAAGLACGFLLYWAVSGRMTVQDFPGQDPFYGFQMASEQDPGAGIVTRHSVDAPGVSGTLKAHWLDASCLLEMDLDLDPAATLAVNHSAGTVCSGYWFDDPGGQVVGVWPRNLSMTGQGKVRGRILFSLDSQADRQLTVVLRRDEAPLQSLTLEPGAASR